MGTWVEEVEYERVMTGDGYVKSYPVAKERRFIPDKEMYEMNYASKADWIQPGAEWQWRVVSGSNTTANSSIHFQAGGGVPVGREEGNGEWLDRRVREVRFLAKL